MKIALVFSMLMAAVYAQESSLNQELANRNQVFSERVYKYLAKKETGNFLVSPESLAILLDLVYEGAKGQTANEMEKSLNLPSDKKKVRDSIEWLLSNLQNKQENYTLTTANKIYIEDGFPIEKDFKAIAENSYKAGIQNIEFRQAQQAASTINKWVEDQTNEKIKNLVSPNQLENVVIVLVNALYFKGTWAQQFKTHLTRKQSFYKTSSEIVKVDTMHITGTFNYSENTRLGLQFLELPYIGDDITLTVVLPNEKNGLTALESKNLEDVFRRPKFTNQRLQVSLPKFLIESKIEFIPILKCLGVKTLFTRQADLSGISKSGEDLHVSQIIQKTFINVTEEGTEAAAATAVIVSSLGAIVGPPSDIRTFIADHPFIYIIKLKDVVLFTGRVSEPKL